MKKVFLSVIFIMFIGSMFSQQMLASDGTKKDVILYGVRHQLESEKGHPVVFCFTIPIPITCVEIHTSKDGSHVYAPKTDKLPEMKLKVKDYQISDDGTYTIIKYRK